MGTLCALALAQGTFGCGESDVVLDRIVGGENAVKHSIPWQAALTRRGSNFVFCGGTVIDETHIMTAAHCTESNRNLDVLIGEHDVTVAQGETRHRVARIIDHPSYGTNGIDYDYSILELDCNDKIDLTDKARAACLPSGNDASRYESAATYNVSGWGTLAAGGSTPEVLNVVQVPPVTDTVCRQQYGTSQITARMMCAGKPGTGGVDSCQGDSGGPLTWFDSQSSTWKLVGAVSWGVGCGGPNHSGVYAEVETVLNWVKENSGSNCGGSNPTAAPTNPPTEGPNPTTEGPNPTTEGPNPTTEGPNACQGSWIGDGECDDINNTEECQWDGGDCCGDDVATDYCTICECLDPDFEETCEDNWSERRCRRVARRGRCDRGNLDQGRGPIANCRKTCEHC